MDKQSEKWNRDAEGLEFEAALKQHLREPVEVPAGFAEGVLARALADEAEQRRSWRRRAIAAALLGATMLSGAADAWHRRESERARVQAQFALAMRIADETIQAALARGMDGQIKKAANVIKEAGQ